MISINVTVTPANPAVIKYRQLIIRTSDDFAVADTKLQILGEMRAEIAITVA